MILLVLTFFLFSLLQSRIKNQTIAEVEQQGLQVMQAITQIVRNADTINSPAVGTSSASLSLNTYTALNNPTVLDLTGGLARIQEGGTTAVPLTNGRVIVSGITFQNLSRASTPGVVRIQFTVTHVNTVGRNEYNFSKTFYGSASLRQP